MVVVGSELAALEGVRMRGRFWIVQGSVRARLRG